jgi:hypothetical protein
MRLPITKLKENHICAEIGVWEGRFSAAILKRGNPKELHLIDPWVHQDYENRYYSIEQEEMDQKYNDVKQRFSNDDRVKIHRKFSTDVSFPEQYFDWVYIDGDHTYEMVLKDLMFYYPLIKKGGWLCGDDYGWGADRPDANGGPKPAVDEFVALNNLEVEIKGGQYAIPV